MVSQNHSQIANSMLMTALEIAMELKTTCNYDLLKIKPEEEESLYIYTIFSGL